MRSYGKIEREIRRGSFFFAKFVLSLKYRFYRRRYLGKYVLCSLGWNCLPRRLATEWRLKANRKMGELSCPFDLAGHQAKVGVNIIERDFAGYLDNVVHNVGDARKIGEYTADFVNPDWNALYVHDEDCKTIEDFKKRYVARIENFRNVMNGDKPVLFVYNARKDATPNVDTHDDIQRLCDVVMSRVHSKKSRFVVITPYDIGTIKGAHVYLAKWPVSDYNWWIPQHRWTLHGIRWERGIMKFLYSELKDMLKK